MVEGFILRSSVAAEKLREADRVFADLQKVDEQVNECGSLVYIRIYIDDFTSSKKQNKT